MVHRDPETGQFLPDGVSGFTDYETINWRIAMGVEAANLTGATGFDGENFNMDGEQLYDLDDVIDRNEVAVLLAAEHTLSVMPNSTETADGTVAAAMVPTSGTGTQGVASVAIQGTSTIQGSIVGGSDFTDTHDFIGRPLSAWGGAPFSDGATGVGGGGSAGEDRVEYDRHDLPEFVAEFHPRDEVNASGQIRAWNIDDSGVHALMHGRHLFGIAER